MCRQVRELYPKDLQDGKGPLPQVHLLKWRLAQAQGQVVQRKSLLGLRLVVMSLKL